MEDKVCPALPCHVDHRSVVVLEDAVPQLQTIRITVEELVREVIAAKVAVDQFWFEAVGVIRDQARVGARVEVQRRRSESTVEAAERKCGAFVVCETMGEGELSDRKDSVILNIHTHIVRDCAAGRSDLGRQPRDIHKLASVACPAIASAAA
jgi:hypothetical protein